MGVYHFLLNADRRDVLSFALLTLTSVGWLSSS